MNQSKVIKTIHKKEYAIELPDFLSFSCLIFIIIYVYIYISVCKIIHIVLYMLVIDAQRQIFQLAVVTTVGCFFSLFTYLAIDIFI